MVVVVREIAALDTTRRYELGFSDRKLVVVHEVGVRADFVETALNCCSLPPAEVGCQCWGSQLEKVEA
jgi:hypothetical protein